MTLDFINGMREAQLRRVYGKIDYAKSFEEKASAKLAEKIKKTVGEAQNLKNPGLWIISGALLISANL